MTTFYSYIQVEEDVGILEQGVPTKRQPSIAETIGQPCKGRYQRNIR